MKHILMVFTLMGLFASSPFICAEEAAQDHVELSAEEMAEFTRGIEAVAQMLGEGDQNDETSAELQS